MPPKKNPLRLNKLQLRTLALAQVLAQEEEISRRDEATGAVKILYLPRPHGSHMHIGGFVVSSRDGSGFSNPAVWKVLIRKGLARVDDLMSVTLTADGVAYDTGLSDRFVAPSDH